MEVNKEEINEPPEPEVTSLAPEAIVKLLRDRKIFRTFVEAPTKDNPTPDTLEIYVNGPLLIGVGYCKAGQGSTAVTQVPLKAGEGKEVRFYQENGKGDFYIARGTPDSVNGWRYFGPNFQTKNWDQNSGELVHARNRI